MSKRRFQDGIYIHDSWRRFFFLDVFALAQTNVYPHIAPQSPTAAVNDISKQKGYTRSSKITVKTCALLTRVLACVAHVRNSTRLHKFVRQQHAVLVKRVCLRSSRSEDCI